MTIDETFPELSKYIEEIPLKIWDAELEIDNTALISYYNSLDALLTNYAGYHLEITH